jgi:hypothetical protein
LVHSGDPTVTAARPTAGHYPHRETVGPHTARRSGSTRSDDEPFEQFALATLQVGDLLDKGVTGPLHRRGLTAGLVVLTSALNRVSSAISFTTTSCSSRTASSLRARTSR